MQIKCESKDFMRSFSVQNTLLGAEILIKTQKNEKKINEI